MATFQCFDDPAAILEKAFCVTAVSKDLKGELKKVNVKEQKCSTPKCKTLRVLHNLKVDVNPTACDAVAPLNGTLEITRLCTAFDTDGHHRGVHAGDFTWSGSGGLKLSGRMSGVTNEGSHRLPIKACQKCNDLGIMEGKLCGQVTDGGQTPKLKGCQVIAAYRIKFDPSVSGGEGAVVGTLEGVMVCMCSAV